ncbi:MAG: RidA family protein [SAR202 cluster bacterium]|nr:RidA family protein [SAR202 cluster bacterium]
MKKVRNNHEDIYPASAGYVRAIRAGDMLFISGTTARGTDAQGGSPMEQLRVVLDRITRIVVAEGGQPSDIVKLTTYVTDRSDFWPFSGPPLEVLDEFFHGEYPTNALLEISGLAEDGLVVEIDAIAVLD